MAIVDDILKLTLFSNLRGTVMLNVFFYRVTADDVTALDVATSFDIAVLPDIAAILSDNVQYDLIDVVNLFDTTDFAAIAPSTPTGANTFEDIGLFTALGFKFPTADKAIRAGSKRFGGVPTGYTLNGVITDAGYITAMQDAAAAMLSNLAAGTGTITPVVVKRIREVNEEGEYTYRLPENQLEASDYEIDIVQPELELTTQNSRKSGVGI